MDGAQSVVENRYGFSCNQSRGYLYRSSKWVTCEIIEIFCFVLAFYLLYALVHHRLMQNRKHTPLGLKKKGGTMLENLCIAGISFSLIRLTINQILLYQGWASSSFCSIFLNLSIAMYCVSIHPVYLFLWMRQRIFYSNPALQHLYSRYIRCLSWMTLACFSITSVVSMVLFVIDAKNSASGRVCEVFCKQNQENQTYFHDENLQEGRYQGTKVNTTAGLVVSVIQILFLVLFLYPIVHSRLQVLRTEHMQNRSKALMTLIKRSFLVSVCCIFSDIAIVFIIKGVHYNFPDAIFAPLATYDVNLILNFVCVIITFRNWRKVLFPWYYTFHSRNLMPQTKKELLRGKSSITMSTVT